jgi:isopenicillin N synthase-like dioxygenase
MPGQAIIPIIDISPLSRPDEQSCAAVAAEIGRACRGVGFFYAVGHGVPRALTERIFAVAAEFFARPLAEKMAVALTRDSGFRGYFPVDGEVTDPAVGADPKEGFDIAGDIVSDLPAAAPFRAANRWPAYPAELRSVLTEYHAAMCEVGRTISGGFALSLGLKQGFFADKLDQPTAILRLLHYPPIPASALPGELPPNGCGAHSDYGYLTMLAQDRQGGLQVQTRDGAWIDAPPIDGALVCNIGEMMALWTDGVFRATPHRVVRLRAESRYSIPFFFHPNPDVEIGRLSDGPQSADPLVTSGEYLLSRLLGAYV